MAKMAAFLRGSIALLLLDCTACFLAAPTATRGSLSCRQEQRSSSSSSSSPHHAQSARTLCWLNSLGRSARRRPRPTETGLATGAEGSQTESVDRERVVIEAPEAGPRGPEGSIKLTYLEGNSWLWQVNGLNILVDPVFGTLDFGIPALIKANKRVLWDSERVTRDLAAVTDFVVISQGFEDHCHPRTLEALSGLLDRGVRVIAPPSAKGVIEEYFPASRTTYILPGESTLLSKNGRGVEVRATTGAVLGPPWQQAENGYILRSAAASEGGEAPEGGTLYFEAHLMYNEAELSALSADVVIAPVVLQRIGAYTLVDGGSKALKLAATLKAKKVVTMANGELDITGPLQNVVTPKGTLHDFLELASAEGVTVVPPKPAVALDVWP